MTRWLVFALKDFSKNNHGVNEQELGKVLINNKAGWRIPGGSLHYSLFFYICLKTYILKVFERYNKV